MAKLQIKKSNETGKVPQPSDLDWGELALNYTDGKLFYKKHGTNTVELLTSVTRLRGTTSGTYTSGDLTLVAGTNITVTQSGSEYTIASAGGADSTKLPLAGGTLTGTLNFNSADQSAILQHDGTATAWYGRLLVKNATADISSFLGNYNSKAGVFAHNNALTAWAPLYVNTLGNNGGGTVYLPHNATYTLSGDNTAYAILNAGNYNSYAPTLTGTGASGTWGISVTGSAASAASATTVSRGSGNIANVTAPGSGTYNQHVLYATNAEFGIEAALATDSLAGTRLPLVFSWRGGYDTLGGLKITGASSAQLGGNAILHAGNYNSYALPLTGGTLSGALSITDATQSTSTGTGSFITAGGVGIAKNLYVGNTIYITRAIEMSTTNNGLYHASNNMSFDSPGNDTFRIVNGRAAGAFPATLLFKSGYAGNAYGAVIGGGGEIRLQTNRGDAFVSTATNTAIADQAGANRIIITGDTTQIYNNLTLENSGSLTAGAISASNITITGELRGPATMYIDPAAVGDNTGTLVIRGNLQVDGTTTTINSTTVAIDDLNIQLAADAPNAAAANGAGISVAGAGATFTYTSANDSWNLNKKTKIGSESNNNGNALTIANGPYNQVNITHATSNSWGLMLGFGDGSIVGNYHGTNHAAIINVQDAPLHLGTNNDAKFSILGNGNTGIGIISPSYKLDVYNNASDAGSQIRIKNAYQSASADAIMNIDGYGASVLKLWRNGIEEWKLERIVGTDNLQLSAYGGAVSGGAGVGTVQFWDYDTGNVGIGTAEPGLKLHVRGDEGQPATSGSTQNGLVRVHAGSTEGYGETLDFGVHVGASGPASYAWLQSTNWTNLAINYNLALNPNGGNVGIGTTAPGTILDVNGNVRSRNGGFILSTGTTQQGGLFMYNRISGSGTDYSSTIFAEAGLGIYFAVNGSANRAMVLNSSGNLGIGTTSPESIFHISTTSSSLLRLTRSSNVVGIELAGGASGGWGLFDYARSAYDIWMINGNVGIGTTNPSWLLTAYAPSVPQFALQNATRSFILTNNSGDNLLSFNYGGVNRLQFDTTNQWINSGNLGIGFSPGTNPSYKLHVTGDIYANGGWLRVSGNQGLYFETWAGGWYMQDSTWIRTYNEKSVYTGSGVLGTNSGGVSSGYGGASPPSGGAIISGNTGIGTQTPQYKLDVYQSGIAASFGATIGSGQIAGIHFGYSEATNTAYRKSALVFERTDNNNQGGNASGKIHFLLMNGSSTSATSLAHSVVTIDSDANGTIGSVRMGVGTTTPTYTLQVNGSFAATTKSFVINHPTKPGKKLRYGSLEGPENGVYVRGRLRGTKIQLPDYWTKLVDPDSITVQLTPHGRRQDVWVTKIENNCVYVSGTTQPDCYYFIQAERVDVEKLQVELDA